VSLDPPEIKPVARAAFLTHTPPLPLVSGERIRNWNLMRELAARGWEVSLFSLLHAEKAPSSSDRAKLEEVCEEVVLAPLAVSPLRRKARIARDLALRRAFQSSFFYSRECANACRSWLAERAFDVVVIETHYMVPYLPRALFARAVFDSHNSETRRVSTMAQSLGLSLRGLVARLQREAVVRFERRVVKRVARTLAVSEEELKVFEPFAAGRVDLVPNGVDCERLELRSALPGAAEILFIGSLDYSANVDALAFLVDAVLPLLERRDAALSVVGSHPRDEVYEIAERSRLATAVSADVLDTTPYWERARALVVPLRVGGGTRLKILEALARGVPVVTTSLGCEGLGLRSGQDVLVADDAETFAACVDRLLGDDELCRALASQGRIVAEARFDWRTIGDAFESSLSSVICSA
jgi:glycosyltransferase involved in cell wall biosynthesis